MTDIRDAAIGIAEHNGWANVAAVAIEAGSPRILARWRMDLIEPGLPKQPYHHQTLDMSLKDGERLIAEVRASAARTTLAAVEAVDTHLPGGYRVTAIATRVPPMDALPSSLAEVHASWHLTCRADGMIYHEALRAAAKETGLPMTLVRRGDAVEKAAGCLRMPRDDYAALMDRLGKELGPPWRQDERFAAAAAIVALTEIGH